jgi:hypothetical protein
MSGQIDRVRPGAAAGHLDRLHQWLIATLGKASAKSEIASAINYSLKRWSPLTRHCDDGLLEIDTDAFDKRIRPAPCLERSAGCTRSPDQVCFRHAGMRDLP